LLSTSGSFSQLRGIQFEEHSTWEEIKKKSQSQHKYIFMDCFATWCVPCKLMDKTVFSNDTVGTFFNENFICVKVQMDSTAKDDLHIKNWFKDAHDIKREAQINFYPTILFFNSHGALIHKGVGFKTASELIKLGKDALSPQRQYFSQLEQYEKGKLDYGSIRGLIMTAIEFNDTVIARKLASDYIENYLLRRKQGEYLTKENVQIITAFSNSSRDPGFLFLMNNVNKVNEVMKNPGFAQSALHYIIYMEIVEPVFNDMIKTVSKDNSKVSDPNWDSLRTQIRAKFNDYFAKRVVYESKIRWYQFTLNKERLSTSIVSYVTSFRHSLTAAELNSYAWDVFQTSRNKSELNAAKKWAKYVAETSRDTADLLPNAMDTYANLLYKLGDFDKAVAMETLAIDIAEKSNYMFKHKLEEFRTTLTKMKKRETLGQ
jgi:thioredoxin-related protein